MPDEHEAPEGAREPVPADDAEVVHDAEVVDEGGSPPPDSKPGTGTELARTTRTQVEPVAAAGVTLWGTSDPLAIVQKATALADTLKGVLTGQNMTTKIGPSEHVNVEGWQTVGTLLGVYPIVLEPEPWGERQTLHVKGKRRKYAYPNGQRKLVEETEFTYDVTGHSWKCVVEVRTLAGLLVGSGTGYCNLTEPDWHDRDDQARASMAQTRAIGRAMKGPLGFVVNLAGYKATPSEEMPPDQGPQGPLVEVADADLRRRASAAIAYLLTLPEEVEEDAPDEAAKEVWAQAKQLVDVNGLPKLVAEGWCLAARKLMARTAAAAEAQKKAAEAHDDGEPEEPIPGDDDIPFGEEQ